MSSYKVRLIPPNLRKNETIIQIADSLDHLSKVVDDIMMRIEKRVDSYNDELNSVSNRVQNVENKIQRLKDVKTAVQVFSSSKYPASDTSKSYTSIFPTNSEIPLVRHEVSEKYPLKKDEPFDKLHIYHVKLSKAEAEKVEGLGKIPNDVNDVSDLILYNTGRNPYREFVATKPLQMSVSSSKAENNRVQLGSAPASISERSFSNFPNQEYFYSPDLGDVPSLDIPEDLPDLPGIASNVRYQGDTDFVIAPSVSKNSSDDRVVLDDHLENLPEILPSQIEEEELPKLPEKIKVEEPEQEPVKQQEIVRETYKKEETVIESVEEETKFESKIPKVAPVPDARASLMEAIREAGGKKALKSVDAKPATKHELSGGDLMADLHNKLAMRRKGISGAKKNIDTSEVDSRGALSLMSAMIPPPEDSNEETDHEEDWE